MYILLFMIGTCDCFMIGTCDCFMIGTCDCFIICTYYCFMIGTCDCDEGFSGTDCTVLVYSPPKLAKLPNYGLCDSRQRNCTIVTVYGQNYINASDLTCHIREYQVRYIALKTLICKRSYVIPCPKGGR